MDREVKGDRHRGTPQDPKRQVTDLFCDECLTIDKLTRIIGRLRGADAKEIERVEKQLLKRYHPDVNHGSGAEESFKQIKEAFMALENGGVPYARGLADDAMMEDFMQRENITYTPPAPVNIDDIEDMIPEHLRGHFGGRAHSGPNTPSSKTPDKEDSLGKIFTDSLDLGKKKLDNLKDEAKSGGEVARFFKKWL